jgi:hypothetical protein
LDGQLLVICLLTAGINLVGTLAYAARIAGVRTRRIAMGFAVFNVLALVSRTSNSFLGPFLAKRIESRLESGGGDGLAADFRVILASASVAVLVGVVLVPTGQRLFTAAIGGFQRRRSMARLLLHSASGAGIHALVDAVAIPTSAHVRGLARPLGVGPGVLVANVLAQALLSVGVFASLYAGFLNPEFRVTASMLSSVINGVATILLFALIDPQLSVMTDDVVEGRIDEPLFRRTIVWVSLSRLGGTVLAQVLFLPAARFVAWIANQV